MRVSGHPTASRMSLRDPRCPQRCLRGYLVTDFITAPTRPPDGRRSRPRGGLCALYYRGLAQGLRAGDHARHGHTNRGNADGDVGRPPVAWLPGVPGDPASLSGIVTGVTSPSP